MKRIGKYFLSINNVEQLPEDMSGLKKLTDLTATENQLRYVPPSIQFCEQLTILKLDDNQLESLPETIGSCTELTELIIKSNMLSSLPKSITKLTKLTHFNVDSNRLTHLPDDIGRLERLTLLSLRSNDLTKLPNGLGDIKGMQVLDIANNKLQSLPLGLKDVKLRALWLSENQSQSIIKMQETTDSDNNPCLTCFLLPQLPNEIRPYQSTLGGYAQHDTIEDLNAINYNQTYEATTNENEQRRQLLFNNENLTEMQTFDSSQAIGNHREEINNDEYNSNQSNRADQQPFIQESNFSRTKEATPHPGQRRHLQNLAKNVVDRANSNSRSQESNGS